MDSKLRSITTSLKRRAPRKAATTLTLGALAAALAISASAPAFAGKPHQSRHGDRHQQTREQELSAARKGKSNKSKSVKRTFSSDGAIAIPAEGSTDTISAGDPYPSTIAVKGFKKARVRDVNLTLHDFSHRFPLDVDVMLVAPGGRNAIVMNDVGGNLPGDEAAVSDLVLTLDDEAAESLPVDTRLTSGTFSPVEDENADDFPAPAPAPSGRTALSTFDGINPNGQWQLFIVDDASGDTGSLAEGWALEITAKSKVKNKGNGKKKR